MLFTGPPKQDRPFPLLRVIILEDITIAQHTASEQH